MARTRCLGERRLLLGGEERRDADRITRGELHDTLRFCGERRVGAIV